MVFVFAILLHLVAGLFLLTAGQRIERNDGSGFVIGLVLWLLLTAPAVYLVALP